MKSQIIFDKDAKTNQLVKDSIFNKLWEETRYPCAKEWSQILTLHHIQKITQNDSKL